MAEKFSFKVQLYKKNDNYMALFNAPQFFVVSMI